MATILRTIFAQISVNFFVQSRESANWITKASREKSHEKKARIKSRKKVAKTKNESANLDDT